MEEGFKGERKNFPTSGLTKEIQKKSFRFHLKIRFFLARRRRITPREVSTLLLASDEIGIWA